MDNDTQRVSELLSENPYRYLSYAFVLDDGRIILMDKELDKVLIFLTNSFNCVFPKLMADEKYFNTK